MTDYSLELPCKIARETTMSIDDAEHLVSMCKLYNIPDHRICDIANILATYPESSKFESGYLYQWDDDPCEYRLLIENYDPENDNMQYTRYYFYSQKDREDFIKKHNS